jgi:hypothetical protein
MTPPSHDVPHRREIGIAPGHAFVYFRRDSNHPYHAVHNLLDERTIDVIVQFIESGPSRRLYGDALPNESSDLCPTELASLWEIEPPTDDERQLDELLTRISETDNTEERSPLMEQLRIVSQRVKAQRRAITRSIALALPDTHAAVEKPKVCYACETQRVREGSAFCSDACAQAAAERYVQEKTRGWCSVCGKWLASEGCPHSN